MDGKDLLAETGGKDLLTDADMPEEMTWLEVGGRALENTPDSAKQLVGDLWNAIRHPIDTGGAIKDIAVGAVRLIDGDDGGDQEAKAKAVAKFFKERYWNGIDGFKRAFASDPVSIVADLSTVLSGGGLAAARAPGLAGQVAGVALKAGKAIDPLAVMGKGAALGVNTIAGPAYHLATGMLTGQGARMTGQAYEAGKQGSKPFYDTMRGAPGAMQEMVTEARTALQNLKIRKNAEYTKGMETVHEASRPIPMGPINKAFRDVAERGSFKGVAVNKGSEKAFREMATILDNWRMRDPGEFHTPAGMDALKKQIQGVADGFSLEEKTARTMVANVHRAIRAEIDKAAPGYAKTMKAYEEASAEIANMEKSLGLGKKATPDRAMRAISSAGRNNVNTNFGERTRLVESLERAGAPELMNRIAGAGASSLNPRGIQGATAPMSAVGIGYAASNPLAAVPALALSSPRIVGELNAAAGRAMGAAKRIGDSEFGAILQKIQSAARLPAYQGGRLEEDLRMGAN